MNSSLPPPRVTVLMTTYNGRRYIGEAIASVLAQTMRDFEMLIYDDASTDGTPLIVAAIDDPRIRFIAAPANGGVVASRNHAIGFARGEYIASIDHDDLWEPEKLARQVAFLDATPDAVAVTCIARELRPGRAEPGPSTRLHAADPIALEWLLHTGNPLVYSCLMFRHSALSSLDCFMTSDAIYADDYDLYHRLMPLGPIMQLPEELATYRYHATNTAKAMGETMQRNAATALARSLRARRFHRPEEWVVPTLIAHAGAGEPLRTDEAAVRVLASLDALRWHFVVRLHADSMTEAAFARIDEAADDCRRRLFRASLRCGNLRIVARAREFLGRRRLARADVADLALSAGVGLFRALGRSVRGGRQPQPA